MDTKRKFPLSRILRPHADRWHDHTIYPIFLFGYQSGRNRYIMRKDTIRHIGQMQIMRFGSSPRQYHNIIFPVFLLFHNKIRINLLLYFIYPILFLMIILFHFYYHFFLIFIILKLHRSDFL